MKTTMTIRGLIALGAGLAAVLLVPVHAGPSPTQTIEQRLLQYQSRFNDGDAGAVAKLYSEDVVYYDPMGRVHEGRAAVRRYYQGSIAAGFSDMTIEKVEIEALGDTAYDIARYTISDPKGNRVSGYHLAILEKKNGQWMVHRTLVNAGMPGQGPK